LLAAEIAYVEKLKRDYAYDKVEWLDREALAAALGTGVYFGGRRDAGAGHLDPLRFAQGLALAAAKAGARIFEETRASGLSGTKLETSHGRISADTLILAGNGYLDGIDATVEAHVMPIDNYILATAPIGAGRPGGLIPGGEAVSDTRFVVYYFRPDSEGRLLFGGGETYGGSHAETASLVRQHLLRVYPQLRDVQVDFAWGGTLAITRNRLPYIRRLRPGVYVAAGYSGQGVALAPFAGKLLAEAIAGHPGRLDAFAALPVPSFPGGKLLRHPALVAAMTWYRLRDWL
jgi:gamma-glutamylputrescine oxidase